MVRRLVHWCVAAAALLMAAGSLVGPASGVASASTDVLPTLNTPQFSAASVSGSPAFAAPLSSPGGPYLYDRAGRVVFLHGVDAVYKHAPYELYPDPHKPWNFSASDASLMARLGFNVVRLGMTWSGLEPGTAKANNPAICGAGRAANPHQYDKALITRYLDRLTKTVDLLGRYHIFTILDMHQDVYNQLFDGEGAPAWAVCTNGVANVDRPGRWSLMYGTGATDAAFANFWGNRVRGNLQGQYDLVWADVARTFRHNPWVLGYDPFNEPFSTALVNYGDEHFGAQLECFYAGTHYVSAPARGAPRIRCPRHDPAKGVIPTILENDRSHLIFYEPDNYATQGLPTFIGPLGLHNLVYNVHIYCGARSPVTGNPTNVAACADQERHSLRVRYEDRPEMASRVQPGGPAWLVTEFGATSSAPLLSNVTAAMDARRVGWIYWSWKYYDDPTGSRSEGLVMADGRLRSSALVLSQTYPEAVAGRPTAFSFTPATGNFSLSYVPDHRVHAPTVVFVPTAIHYPHGYCASVSGGRVVSRRGSDLLEVQNASVGSHVVVRVSAGACVKGSPRAEDA
ncbi:MAG TPA: cellulase family glycosylhydrolase [Acidimicrobiales bacterium]|nr:cellulase family glycosylhydrolase [Acidimicrobiales bacterium]